MQDRDRIGNCANLLLRGSIFYYADPSGIRKQKKTFAKALDEHKKGSKESREKVENMENYLVRSG